MGGGEREDSLLEEMGDAWASVHADLDGAQQCLRDDLPCINY